MKTYDVVVVGHDISAYVSALYLSKRHRNVAFIHAGKSNDFHALKKPLKDDNNNTYNFNFPIVEIGGLEENELMRNYLQYLKLDEAKLNVLKRKETVLVTKDGRAFSRGNDLNAFIIYLVRHYPRHRNQIHQLKEDILSFYEDFKMMRDNRLKGREYTIPKMYIELGQVSLETFLKRYFNHPVIMEEFRLITGFEAYALKDIHALEYFKRFFNLFVEESFLWLDFNQDFKKIFIQPVKDNVTMIKGTVASIKRNNNLIEGVLLNDETFVQGDYYLLEDVDEMTLKKDFKPIDNKLKAIYIGLDQKPSDLGITETDYLFTSVKCCEALKLWNYTVMHPKSVYGIKVECVNPQTDSDIIETLYKFFPKLKGHIKVTKETDSFQPYSSIPKKVDVALSNRFKRDHLDHLKIAENGYMIVPFINFESGVIGQFMLGVESAERVNKHLEDKESETVRLTQDLLITKIIHGFKRNLLDDTYLLRIEMGKRDCTLRINQNDIYIFNTEDPVDLTLTASYDTFYQLHHGTLTVNQALEQNLLRSEKKPDLFMKVTQALRFGTVKAVFTDYKPAEKPINHLMFSLSIIAFTAYMFTLYLGYSFVSSIVFLSVLALKFGIDNFKFKRHSILDIVFILIGAYFFVDNLLELETNLNFVWVGLASFSFLSILFKRPFMFIELYKDEHPSDAWSPLYKTIMQGLTILWVFSFLIILAITTFTEMPNQLLFIYVMFIMLAVSLRYKTTYINTTLKGRN